MTILELTLAMPPSRRAMLTSTLASAAIGAAGCGARVNHRQSAAARGLDFERLARGFAPLAARAAPGVFNLG